MLFTMNFACSSEMMKFCENFRRRKLTSSHHCIDMCRYCPLLYKSHLAHMGPDYRATFWDSFDQEYTSPRSYYLRKVLVAKISEKLTSKTRFAFTVRVIFASLRSAVPTVLTSLTIYTLDFVLTAQRNSTKKSLFYV